MAGEVARKAPAKSRRFGTASAARFSRPLAIRPSSVLFTATIWAKMSGIAFTMTGNPHPSIAPEGLRRPMAILALSIFRNVPITGVSSNSINNLSSSYVQSIFSNAQQGAGFSTAQTGNASSTQQADNSQLSLFSQVLGTLQQLQQNNPTQYQQVTQQIATNLQSAAQTATSQGNTNAASQLTKLAADFTNASTSRQLPNIQDLAQAAGGTTTIIITRTLVPRGRTALPAAAPALPQTNSPAFQSSATQSEAGPPSIIENTLSTTGIGS